jgi:hypothetical protein
MNAQNLKATLATVTVESMTNGTMSSLWDMLPDMVSGQSWVGEIVACADSLASYIYDAEEIDPDQVRDWQFDYASRELEDYYKNINDRVQALNLWAYDELDEEVAQLGQGSTTLNELNALYLNCALRGLFETVAQWAMDTTEEGVE